METIINRKRGLISGLILFIGVLVGITVLAYAFGLTPWSSKASIVRPQTSNEVVVINYYNFKPFNLIEPLKEEISNDTIYFEHS
jgi:hypothetical protein